jgi:hypothetical protein
MEYTDDVQHLRAEIRWVSDVLRRNLPQFRALDPEVVAVVSQLVVEARVLLLRMELNTCRARLLECEQLLDGLIRWNHGRPRSSSLRPGSAVD